MSFCAAACSVATFWQHVEVSTTAGRVEPLVVARHNLVEHGTLALPGLGGVVEHLVQHDLEAGLVQRPDHGTELRDACAAVRIHRVRALGRKKWNGS